MDNYNYLINEKTHYRIRKSSKFLEQTILTIFLWIGLWGIITMFIDYYMQSFGQKLCIYIIFTIGSFTIMHNRDHLN